MKRKSFQKRVMRSLLFYNILFVLVTVIFCSAIPKLLIYPPDSINTEFERHIDDGYRYDNQCAVIIVIAMLASNILFFVELHKIEGWEKYIDGNIENETDREKLKKIKKNCNTIPTKLYILHAFIPPLAVAIGLIATRYEIYFNNKFSYCCINDIYYHRTSNICFF